MTQGTPSTDTTFDPQEATRLLYHTWREKLVMPLLIGMLVLGTTILIPAVISAEDLITKILFIAAYVVVGIVTVIKFSTEIRVGVFLFAVYLLGLVELLRYGILGDGTFFFLGLVIFAVLLLSPRAGIIAIAVTVLTIAVIGWLILGEIAALPLVPFTATAEPADWVSGSAMLIAIGGVIILGFRRLENTFFETEKQIEENLRTIKDERNNLERKVEERTRQLQRVNEIGRAITTILDPEDLMIRATHLIGDEFECYFTAIFLTDATGRWAELKAATGEAGKVLIENKHHVDVNGNNAVGIAIRERQVCVVSDTSAVSRTENPAQPFTRFSWHGISISAQIARTDNPLLPHTRSQITLPLIIGERVIGALEMHSERENTFTQQDADAYQNMANQVAIALENSRLFTEAQQSIREMDATQQQYIRGAWQSLAAEQNFEYILGSSELAQGEDLEVPLVLREQTLGQIDMTSTDGWNREQKSLIEAIASQAALALENARLVEESQSVAMRERLANEITAKIWSARTLDSILQITVRELGRVLEAAEVNIEVSMGDKDER